MPSSSSHRIPVGVQCADALVARGIEAVLLQEPDVDAELVPGPDAIGGPWPAPGRVRVLVTDFELAIAQVQAARGQPPDRALPHLLVYSPQRRERDIRQALAAGIPGFLGQGFALHELAQAVRTIDRGGRYYDLATTQRVAVSLASEALTLREQEVLGLIVRGECNKTIAARLDVTVGTVKAHVGAILSKLQVASRTQAVRVAVSRGLVDSCWDEVDRAQRPRVAASV